MTCAQYMTLRWVHWVRPTGSTDKDPLGGLMVGGPIISTFLYHYMGVLLGLWSLWNNVTIIDWHFHRKCLTVCVFPVFLSFSLFPALSLSRSLLLSLSLWNDSHLRDQCLLYNPAFDCLGCGWKSIHRCKILLAHSQGLSSQQALHHCHACMPLSSQVKCLT